MGEAAHVQGLASSVTQLVSLVVVVLIASTTLAIYLLFWIGRALLAALEDWRAAAAARALDAAVRSLPTRLADASDAADGTAECAICLLPFASGDRLRALPCCHEYHAHCIDAWMLRPEARGQLRAQLHACPLCKVAITTAANAEPCALDTLCIGSYSLRSRPWRAA
uniref:RING-type domain-containing protein n=1 Tax=Calcidiscus leptoporus TaxID=127549 RepID=A0A7S0IU28_9EUKA|mmetsp:Transcript_22661/g.52236  ORF Transcript_22661/g.52236 Transcript_22661/m.52236 type:complete len:167 (+) Transcript_22661:177-677(+)